jgi:hypothetical protein
MVKMWFTPLYKSYNLYQHIYVCVNPFTNVWVKSSKQKEE